MLLSLRLGLAVSLSTLIFPSFSAVAQSCPSLTIPSSTLPATQPNSRFFNEVFGIARPSLTINGFTCNRPGGDCRRGLGLKEIVEAVHSTSSTYSAVNTHAGTGPVLIDRSTVLPVHRRLMEDAQEGWIADPGGSASPYDKVLQNAYVLQARGYAALVSYLVEASGFSPAQANACTGATAPQHQLRAHSTERSAFLYALKTSAGWLPMDIYNHDGTKWRLVVTDVARAIDLYLGLENAYTLKSPESLQYLLTESEKSDLQSDLHTAVTRVEAMYNDILGDVGYNRYEYEAGNWALTVQASLAYATLAMQASPDGCRMLSTWNYPCNRAGLLQRGFRTLRQAGEGNHQYSWSFGTHNGRRFWSEGPYYFQIMLDQVIPFWHTVRMNNLYSQAGFPIPNDPFYDPFLTSPINWLADITTPLGETPPLDDGNRRPMYNAMILRWQSGYGDETIGQKFAWIADRVRVPGSANEAGFAAASHLRLLEMAIPRVPLNVGSPPASLIGQTSLGVNPGEQDEQQLVVRHTSGANAHYLLLNGETAVARGSSAPGAAITSGEGHEQPDNMQVLYYINEYSVLMDMGYDSGSGGGLSGSTWNDYRYNNSVRFINEYTNGGLQSPRIDADDQLRRNSSHAPISSLYTVSKPSLTLLHGFQELGYANGSGSSAETYRAAYGRDVILVKDASNPYIIDINRTRAKAWTGHTISLPPCELALRYNFNTDGGIDIPQGGAASSSRWFATGPLRRAGNVRAFVYLSSAEQSASYAAAKDVSVLTGTNETQSREFNDEASSNNVASTSIQFCDDGGEEFSGIGFITAAASQPTTTPQPFEASTPSSGRRAWVWKRSATQFDVLAVRSVGDASNEAFVFNPRSSGGDSPSIWLQIPAASPGASQRVFGFTRVNVSGGIATMDPGFTLNLAAAQAPPISVNLVAPECAMPNQPAHISSNTTGGLRPYNHMFETKPLGCGGGGEMSAVQGSVTEGDEGGPVLDGLPSCSWSYAGGGTNWYTDVSLPSDFEVRLTVTDFEGNSVTTIPQWVDVSSVCGSNLSQNPADVPEIGSATLIPARFAFDAPAPNPFSSQTRFRFSLPAPTQVDIRVFDVLGREVSTVLSEVRGAGIHEAAFLGDNLPNGTYIVRLRAGTDVASRIVILRR